MSDQIAQRTGPARAALEDRLHVPEPQTAFSGCTSSSAASSAASSEGVCWKTPLVVSCKRASSWPGDVYHTGDGAIP
jgi:hypothetical protein